MDATSEDAQQRRGFVDTLLEIGRRRKELLVGIRDALDSHHHCERPCIVKRLAAELVGRAPEGIGSENRSQGSDFA